MAFVSYWIFPILSGLIWLATLLGLLLYWILDTNQVKYPSMQGDQTIAYISDIGASKLKPLFVVGCVLTTIFLDLAFISDRLLRHKGLLVPNTSVGEKVLSALCIFFAIVGTIGLTFLSGFDTARYPRAHDIFLLFFIAGYLFSAIFICWEFQRLGKKYRQHRILTISFWIKLTFVVVELGLAVGFAATRFRKNYNKAAILEWVVALVFSFYVFSFVIDLWPAVATRRHGGRYHLRPMTTREMEEAVRTGQYPDTRALARPEPVLPPRTTHDSDRTLTNPTIIPAAAAAAPPNHHHHHKTRRTHADNF